MFVLSYSTNRDGLSFDIASFACYWKADEAAGRYARDFAARYSNHAARTFDVSDTVAGRRQFGRGVIFECTGGCGCARPGLIVRFRADEADAEPGDMLPIFHDNRHAYEADGCE